MCKKKMQVVVRWAFISTFMLFNFLPSKGQVPHESSHERLGNSDDAYEINCLLVDERNRPIFPAAIVEGQGNLYLLGPQSVWKVAGGLKNLKSLEAAFGQPGFPLQRSASRLPPAPPLHAVRIGPPEAAIAGIPIQELCGMTFCPGRGSLVVLDKAGDLFEFLPDKNLWRVLKANFPRTGSPDPEYIDIASLGSRICALDPERNEIWRLPQPMDSRASYFKEVLPWRVKPGDPCVADGLAIAQDEYTYVVKRSGRVTRYGGGQNKEASVALPFPWKPAAHMRPSRLATGHATPLYIIERENNRVIAVNKTSGKGVQFLFAAGSDLRGLLPGSSSFWIIDGSRLRRRALTGGDSRRKSFACRRIDSRLDGLVLPLAGAALPRHPGVWPGARRLYRFGIHQGIDFFCDAAAGGRIEMGTKVRAADAGKVIRADVNFHDMDARTYARVMRQCRGSHMTSEPNEDLLRGCQVWIDHGRGLVTRYAHLSSVARGITAGKFVRQGDIIGFVGVSGTGQNLPGAVKHPHLHFEIWLDGHYLGWGLNQPETLGVLEDIFGRT